MRLAASMISSLLKHRALQEYLPVAGRRVALEFPGDPLEIDGVEPGL
jgi:hypothetical protein